MNSYSRPPRLNRNYPLDMRTLRIVAKLALVCVGGIRNAFDDRVREDFTDASLSAVRLTNGFTPLDFALSGGEPYAIWF